MTEQNIKLTEKVELRPVVMPDDEEFLKSVYASTRDDVQYLPFDDAGKQAFILMQYTAQKNHYDEYYKDAKHWIVLYEGNPAGRHMIDYGREDIRLVDMAILPEYRGKGIGTVLFKDAFKDSVRLGLPCILHVIKENPAIPMYERLGFRTIGETGIHDKMEWRPPETEYNPK
jgi:GNAT superfamily N-acetyltransferase